jgi:hypothetical protein
LKHQVQEESADWRRKANKEKEEGSCGKAD